MRIKPTRRDSIESILKTNIRNLWLHREFELNADAMERNLRNIEERLSMLNGKDTCVRAPSI